MAITIAAEAGGQAGVFVARNEFYIDGPTAGVGPRTLPGEKNPPEVTFNIRAWKEGQKARVVVYARMRDTRAPDGATETAIATFVMAPGETLTVPEAEKWGGQRLTLTAAHR